MSTDSRNEHGVSRSDGLGEAFYFDCGDHKSFAWLHLPGTETIADVGLVICKPFGYEAICAHRSMRAFADAAVKLGMPTLRFDYLGTGDSADIDAEADQVHTWTGDVIAAAGELRRRTGVKRICLLGFRFGALLAARAAIESPGLVNALVLIAPVVSGRRYVRELRTTRLAAMLGSESPEGAAGALSEVPSVPPGSMEVSGFSLSAATLAALSNTDLTRVGTPPAADMLIIDGEGLPASRAWADALTALGGNVCHQTRPGLVQMLMTAPQFAKIPQLMIQTTSEWLGRLLAAGSAIPRVRGEIAAATGEYLALSSDAPGSESAAATAIVREHPVFFGSDALLFGIVSEPPSGERRRRAVILLNAGADYHIGASGLYVALARRWARRGYFVLRMDFGGIGDSGTRAGRPDEEVFPPAAVDDMRAAIEMVRTVYGVQEFTLAGLCSGAYHALRAAIHELPTNRILMINPQNYFWKEGMTVNDMQAAEVVRNPAMYRARLFSVDGWRKLLAGQVNVAYIVKIFANRLAMAMASSVRDVARRLRIHLPGDLGWELERIAARGVTTVFVFARGEPGIPLLKIQAGSSVDRIGTNCRVHILDTGDHVFSKRDPREMLEQLLDQELFARSATDTGDPRCPQLEHSP